MFKLILPKNTNILLDKLNQILTDEEKKVGKTVVWILILTMVLEIFGIGIIVPFLLITIKKNFDESLELPEFLNFFYELPSEFILYGVLIFFLIKPIILYYFNYYNNKYIFWRYTIP